MRNRNYLAIAAAAAALAACSTAQDQNSDTVSAGTSTTGSADTSTGTGTTGTGATAGGTTTGGTGTTGGAGSGIPALVNVNLENVLNDLSVRLNIDRANIPVNAQIPIDVAANVCGVSVNVLSVSTGGQASCTARTASSELVQAVQQQVAAGGNVGGGDQTMGGASTSNQL